MSLVSFRSRWRNLEAGREGKKGQLRTTKRRDASNEPFENLELSSVLCMDVPPFVFVVSVGDDVLAAFEIVGESEEIRMVAEFLEDVDGFERLRPGSSEEFLDLGRLDEVLVEFELEGGEVAEDDGFVLDGN